MIAKAMPTTQRVPKMRLLCRASQFGGVMSKLSRQSSV